MTKTTYILITILAVSFIAMILYINNWTGLSRGELISSILFGFMLVAVAFVFAMNSPNNLPGIPRSGYLRYYSIGLAMVFAIWMLVSILLLPFFGGVGFDLVSNKAFGILWVVLGLIMSPLAKKYIK